MYLKDEIAKEKKKIEEEKEKQRKEMVAEYQKQYNQKYFPNYHLQKDELQGSNNFRQTTMEPYLKRSNPRRRHIRFMDDVNNNDNDNGWDPEWKNDWTSQQPYNGNQIHPRDTTPVLGL